MHEMESIKKMFERMEKRSQQHKHEDDILLKIYYDKEKLRELIYYNYDYEQYLPYIRIVQGTHKSVYERHLSDIFAVSEAILYMTQYIDPFYIEIDARHDKIWELCKLLQVYGGTGSKLPVEATFIVDVPFEECDNEYEMSILERLFYIVDTEGHLLNMIEFDKHNLIMRPKNMKYFCSHCQDLKLLQKCKIKRGRIKIALNKA